MSFSISKTKKKKLPKSGIEKEQTIKQKEKNVTQITIIEMIVVTILCLYVMLTYCAYQSEHPRYTSIEVLKNIGPVISKNPFYLFPINYNIGIALGFTVIVDMFIFLQYTYNKMRVHQDVSTIKGRTEWANTEEITNKYAEFDGNDYRNSFYNTILSENVYESLDAKKHFHALNTLILGTTGSGKTRYVLKPNMLQMNANYVITDPKGGTVTEIGEGLRRHGYNIKVLDIATMTNCDTYNPLVYCDREADVKKIVEAFIKNTDKSGGKGGGNKDPFWDDSMNAFLCCMVSLLTLIPEGCSKPYAQMEEVMGGTIRNATFASITELTRMANKKWTPNCGIALRPDVKLGDGKNNTANASQLSAIFENIRSFEAERQDTTPELITKPYTLREWENFCLAPEKTSTTILMTTAVRLDPFNIEQVKHLTSSDTLDLHNFGNEKCALFLIIPANDRTYNFLAAFVYTQLFDQLYHRCEAGLAGTSDIYLPNRDHLKHFSKEDVILEKDKEFYNRLKTGKIEAVRVEVNGKVSKDIDDSYYDILLDGEWIGRRPTKETAHQFINDCKNSKLKKAVESGFQKLPIPMRLLIDEFPNIGEIPDFKDKISTVRQYDISCTVICQTITQLKGMYPDDYEVIDGNCPQLIFLGGDENSNNEYLSKKMGESTKRGYNNSIDNKKVNTGYQTEGGALMRPEDFGRLDYSQTILFIYGEQPIMDKKYDYPHHRNYKYTYDYANDEHVEAYIFDRSALGNKEEVLSQITVKKAKAVPQIHDFSITAFKETMGKFTNKEALNSLYDNTEDYLENIGALNDDDF
mgnify:CR=1 FL=1